jgi:HSP20 family protein
MLIRFNPFRELDRLTEQARRPVHRRVRPPGRRARIDRSDRREQRPERAIRAALEPREGDEVLVAERPHGTDTRQLFLADTLGSENVHAKYDQAKLTAAFSFDAETVHPDVHRTADMPLQLSDTESAELG